MPRIINLTRPARCLEVGMFARLMNGCYRRLAIAATAALTITLVAALATPASAQYYYPGYPYYSYYPAYPYYPYYPTYSYNPYYYPYYGAGYGSSYPYFGFPAVSLGFRFGGGHHGGFHGFHH
jgi:hypothetical protein